MKENEHDIDDDDDDDDGGDRDVDGCRDDRKIVAQHKCQKSTEDNQETATTMPTTTLRTCKNHEGHGSADKQEDTYETDTETVLNVQSREKESTSKRRLSWTQAPIPNTKFSCRRQSTAHRQRHVKKRACRVTYESLPGGITPHHTQLHDQAA